MGCNHLWNSNDGKGGAALFEVRTSGGEPVMRASCPRCGARAWFTDKQWAALFQAGGIVIQPSVPKKRGGK